MASGIDSHLFGYIHKHLHIKRFGTGCIELWLFVEGRHGHTFGAAVNKLKRLTIFRMWAIPDMSGFPETYRIALTTSSRLQLLDCKGITLRIQRKNNSQRPDAAHWMYLKKQIQQKIEQAFSQITARIPKHIQAITQKVFF